MRSPAVVLASTLLLSACTTPPSPKNDNGVPSGMDAWTAPLYQRNRGLSDATTTASAAIPVLGSPSLAREWGAPSISKSSDGSFRLRYMKKGELHGLVCFSLTSPVSNPASPPAWEEPNGGPLDRKPSTMHPQEWRQAKVAGHAVNWFQQDGGGGADFPVFTTVCFAHTDSSRTGYYIVQAWSDSPEKAAALLGKAAFLPGR